MINLKDAKMTPIRNVDAFPCGVCKEQIENQENPIASTDGKVKFCSDECFGYYRNIKKTMKTAGQWKIKVVEVNIERLVLFVCLTVVSWIFITTTNACGMQCMNYNHSLHSMGMNTRPPMIIKDG